MSRRSTYGPLEPRTATIAQDYQTLYLPWAVLIGSPRLGWRAFGEVEGLRVALSWAGIEVFCWYADYGGAFITFRRVW